LRNWNSSLAAGDTCVLLLLLAAAPLLAADDANAIIERLLEAQKANGDRIQPYTFVEEAVYFTYAKDGKLKKDSSETREVIFVEGLPFRKPVARNGKPLPANEQAEIQKMVNQTAKERRRQPRPAEEQIVMGGEHIDIGANRELLTLFENRLKGEEEIRGRKAWVIEATPIERHIPVSEYEKDLLGFRRTLWIDQADNLPVRMLLAAAGDGVRFAAPGSTVRVDYGKIAPDVWCESALVLEIWHPSGKQFKPWKRAEFVFSGFQKFDVQSTITVVDH
jgi:hypothetical protein